MSQFPHDEFDNVAPYKSDEVGKHRAPGAAAAAGAAGSSAGALKWVGLVAVALIVIGALVFWVIPSGDDEPDPAADEDTSEDDTAGEDAEGNGEADSEDTGEGNDEGDENGNGEAEAGGPLDADHAVRAVNAGAPDGSAGDMTQQLEDLGVNVQQSIDWDPGWGNVTTPQIIFPEDEQQEFAEALAAELGIDTVTPNNQWQTIVVVIGPEYE